MDLPQSLSLPTCIRPSWRGWRATQSVQMREWQSHTMPGEESTDLYVGSWNSESMQWIRGNQDLWILGRVIMNSSCIYQEDSYVTHILISLYTPGHTFSVEGTWILRDGNSVTMDCRHGTRWNINIMIIMSSIIGIHEINHRNILKTLKYKPKCAKTYWNHFNLVRKVKIFSLHHTFFCK